MKIIAVHAVALAILTSSCSRLPEGSAARFDGTPVNVQTPKPAKERAPDGSNRTKKGGWKAPRQADKSEKVGMSRRTMKTTEGKDTEVVSTNFAFTSPWLYSEDFLDLRGLIQLESESFIEHSVEGKVFMYSIFAKPINTHPSSNSDSHADGFVYLILDNDGDGQFETLAGPDREVIVPRWVSN